MRVTWWNVQRIPHCEERSDEVRIAPSAIGCFAPVAKIPVLPPIRHKNPMIGGPNWPRENERVLASLIRKQAEIVGQLEHTQEALGKLVKELPAVDVVIRMFDARADVCATKPEAYLARHAAFRSLTSRDITLLVMKTRRLKPGRCSIALHVEAEAIGPCARGPLREN